MQPVQCLHRVYRQYPGVVGEGHLVSIAQTFEAMLVLNTPLPPAVLALVRKPEDADWFDASPDVAPHQSLDRLSREMT